MTTSQEWRDRLAGLAVLEPLTVPVETMPEPCPVAPEGEECAVIASGEECEIVLAADGTAEATAPEKPQSHETGPSPTAEGGPGNRRRVA
jgi:hypothetical protein